MRPEVAGGAPLDYAEAWLQEHDPIYDKSSQAWRHLRGERCVTPHREEVAGGIFEIERLIEREAAEPLDDPYDALTERECSECQRRFMPYKGDHGTCSKRCYQRAYMRERRREPRP